jgi:hypothetical protein
MLPERAVRRETHRQERRLKEKKYYYVDGERVWVRTATKAFPDRPVQVTALGAQSLELDRQIAAPRRAGPPHAASHKSAHQTADRSLAHRAVLLAVPDPDAIPEA